MRSPSRLTAVLLVVPLLFPTLPSLGAEVEMLGIVVASHSATLGNGIASDGATLYNGDRLVTAPNGGLSLRSGAAMLYMSGSTQLILRQVPTHNPIITKPLTRADVTSGSVSFSLSPSEPFVVSANGALIGAAAPMPTLGEITILDHRSFKIDARRGPLKIVYYDDYELIPEGRSYRVELDKPDDNTGSNKGPKGALSPIKTHPRPSGRRRFIFLFLIGAAAVAVAGSAAGATVGYTQPVESPDCPQPNQCSRPN